MRIVIVGGRGQLGSDLCTVLGDAAIGLDMPEFDATDSNRVSETFAELRPDVVINCAAMTNVDRCETEPELATKVNETAAGFIAQASAACGAKLLFVSTDYVFDGPSTRTAPFFEDDMPNPGNVYALTKLRGEKSSTAGNARCFVVRSSGLFGHAGALGKGGNFVETMLRLGNQGGTVRVVNDQRVSPTATVELAQKMSELIKTGAFGLYHIASSESCTWYEFAKAIFEHEAMRVDVQAIPSSEYPLPAKRPGCSALASRKLAAVGIKPCRSWRTMLGEYLKMREGVTS